MTLKYLAFLASAGAALLAACFDSNGVDSSGGRKPLDEEAFYLGDYDVSGNALFLHQPPETTWICFEETPRMEIEPGFTDTTWYEISGNRLRISQLEDSIDVSGGAEEAWAVVRTHLFVTRVGSGSGIEGRWQIDSLGHVLVSGTLDAETKAELDSDGKTFSSQFRYITMEYDFSGGKAFGRIGGDHAGLFVAQWNGALGSNPLYEPDSALYDVEVSVPAPGTVRLKGRKTGETVTVTFVGPRKSTRYASDRPEHPPYTMEEVYKSCEVEDWYYDFLEENWADIPPLEKGSSVGRHASTKSKIRQNPRKSPFFGLLQGFPLNQPHSLLN